MKTYGDLEKCNVTYISSNPMGGAVPVVWGRVTVVNILKL